LYAKRVVREIPNLFATASGESPETTVYTVSEPTALDGNVVVVPGTVLATGGMVAKFVGVTLTTVVATPNVSPPHAAKPKPEVITSAIASVADFDFGMTRFNNTMNNSRACERPTGGASRQPLLYQWALGGKDR
jgi:hypothetical protein